MIVQTRKTRSTSFRGAKGGFVVWFTGLPAAGKTTIADSLARRLEVRGLIVDQLDGDVIRTHLSSDLGFSRGDRDKNVNRIAWVSSRLARAGAAVLVSVVSPYEEARNAARALVEPFGAFVEVHGATPIVECIRRDPKGLYAEALSGKRSEFTGIPLPTRFPRPPSCESTPRPARPKNQPMKSSLAWSG